jgi:hypothetical protein
MKPQITIDNLKGYHNSQPIEITEKKYAYKNLSTVLIIPTRGQIPAKVVQAWWNLQTPMNQPFVRMFMIGMEVGAAYNAAIETILAHPELSKYSFVATLEEDNIPPPDAFLRMYEYMDKFDCIGSIYWTKGPEGRPMCYGDPNVTPFNFAPFMPAADTITRCNGLGMGCNLFKLKMFKDPKMPRPFFQTRQEYKEGVGSSAFTQDLLFFQEAGKLGYRFGCDSRVKTGHYDYQNDMIW